MLPGKVTKNWRADFESCGVIVGEYMEDYLDKGFMLVTNCSRTKGTSGDVAVPQDFYKGKSPTRLIDYADSHSLRYGILSDLYGIHFDDEALPFYDIGPHQVTDKDGLAKTLKDKCYDKEIVGLVYYNSSPCRARFYLDLMLKAGLKVVYLTKLRDKKRGFGIPWG